MNNRQAQYYFQNVVSIFDPLEANKQKIGGLRIEVSVRSNKMAEAMRLCRNAHPYALPLYFQGNNLEISYIHWLNFIDIGR